VGLWSFADNFRSSDSDQNIILALLFAGPLGVGYALDNIQFDKLLKAVRPDGVIVKPNVTIVPMDKSYQADLQGGTPPMLAYAQTFHNIGPVSYIFAYSRDPANPATISINPSQLGIAGPMYVYDVLRNMGHLSGLPERVRGRSEPFTTTVDFNGSYYVAVPIGPSGIAFLGDKDKWVSLGKKRIKNVTDNGVLTVDVEFAAGEQSVTLQGYSVVNPAILASDTAASLTYDPAARLFEIVVPAGTDSTASFTLIQNGRTRPIIGRASLVIPPFKGPPNRVIMERGA
jgi:hypothetical protein